MPRFEASRPLRTPFKLDGALILPFLVDLLVKSGESVGHGLVIASHPVARGIT